MQVVRISAFVWFRSAQSQFKSRIQISETFPGCDPPRSQLPLSNVEWSTLCHRKKWRGSPCNKIIVKFTRIDRKPFPNTFHFVVRYRSAIIHERQRGRGGASRLRKSKANICFQIDGNFAERLKGQYLLCDLHNSRYFSFR